MAGAKGKKKQSRLAFAPIQDSPPSHRTDASQSALTPSRLRYTNPFTGNITVRGQLQLEDYVRSWGNSMVGGGDKEELAEPGQPSSELDAKRSMLKQMLFSYFHTDADFMGLEIYQIAPPNRLNLILYQSPKKLHPMTKSFDLPNDDGSQLAR